MRKLFFNLHLYTALIVGLFIVIIGVTGSIIAFEEELDRLFYSEIRVIKPEGQMMSAAALLEAANKAYPGQKINTVRVPQSPDDTALFFTRAAGSVYMNPYTGAIVGSRNLRQYTLLQKIYQLHTNLLLGKNGKTVVTSVTGVLLFLLATGLYLWWPLKRITVKWGASWRRIHWDLHNAAGIYAGVFLLILGVTGVVVYFDDDIEDALNHRAGAKKIRKNIPSAPAEAGAKPIGVDAAVDLAQKAMPGTHVLNAMEPNAKGSYIVGLRFPEDRTPGGRSWVNIDQYSGKVVSFQNSRTVATGTRAIIFNRLIHTGDIAGVWTRILMSLSSMVLVILSITGYYLWWKKLKIRQRTVEQEEALSESMA